MIEGILDRIQPITLEEMEEVRLMNRVDTKFLTTLPILKRLLLDAKEDFMVQETNGRRNSPYYTCYFDTLDVKMYCDHERGKKTRKKVRIRQYLDSGLLPFLEIKKKNNKGRTKKKRISMDSGEEIYAYQHFLKEHSEFDPDELAAKIENRFNRITLVNKEKTERITIDTSIEFHNFVSGRALRLPDLVIIEWKRDGRASESRLKPILRELRIKESGFSKYVFGMALTDSLLPQNKLKPRIRMLEKLMK